MSALLQTCSAAKSRAGLTGVPLPPCAFPIVARLAASSARARLAVSLSRPWRNRDGTFLTLNLQTRRGAVQAHTVTATCDLYSTDLSLLGGTKIALGMGGFEMKD